MNKYHIGRDCVSMLVGILLGVASLPSLAFVSLGSGSLSMGSGSLEMACGDLTVGGGGQLSLGDGSIAGAASVVNSGLISGDQGSVVLSGDWVNNANFVPGTSSVSLVDGCASAQSRILGSSTFYNFTVTSAIGRSIVFAAGQAQSVGNQLVMRGVGGAPLPVQSDSAGSQALLRLTPGAGNDLAFLSVRDMFLSSVADPATPLVLSLPNSINAGGNSGWFASAPPAPAPRAVPALSGAVLYALMVFLVLAACVVLKRRGTLEL